MEKWKRILRWLKNPNPSLMPRLVLRALSLKVNGWVWDVATVTGCPVSEIEAEAEFWVDAEAWREREARRIRREIESWREWLGPWAATRREAYGGSMTRITTLDKLAIERAREVPISDVAEVRNGKMLCIYHDDKHPSAWVKRGTNFAYCFVCRRKIDSIGYIMKTKGMRFMDAVRELQR